MKKRLNLEKRMKNWSSMVLFLMQIGFRFYFGTFHLNCKTKIRYLLIHVPIYKYCMYERITLEIYILRKPLSTKDGSMSHLGITCIFHNIILSCSIVVQILIG